MYLLEIEIISHAGNPLPVTASLSLFSEARNGISVLKFTARVRNRNEDHEVETSLFLRDYWF